MLGLQKLFVCQRQRADRVCPTEKQVKRAEVIGNILGWNGLEAENQFLPQKAQGISHRQRENESQDC